MGTYDLNHIENLERGLSQPQAEKLGKVRQNLALSLAREYGNRLSPMMAEIPRARKMAMARDEGKLDSYVSKQVAQRFEYEIAKGYGHGAV